MPTRNVNLTEELDRFVLTKVESGRYENASEVVRAALRTLEREEQQYEAKLAGLRAAIDEGDASGIAEGDVFARIREALHLPAPRSAVGTFRLSRLAEADLLSIGTYTLRTWGEAQTFRYLGELESATSSLPTIPRQAVPVPISAQAFVAGSKASM